MLTPLDIENKEFKKSFRGYDIKEIDRFLDDIIIDYEKVYRENVELKDKVNLFSAQIRYYNTMEETLKETLITAQTTSEEIISVARAKAINITDEAEINGKRINELANERVRDIRQEYEHLKKEMLSFKTRYQTFIEAQLLSLEKFHKDMEVETEKPTDNDLEASDYEDSKDSDCLEADIGSKEGNGMTKEDNEYLKEEKDLPSMRA